VHRRIVAATSASILAICVILASLLSPWAVGGCQTHQCDAFWQTMGTIASPESAGVGNASISTDGTEIVWESSPLYGQWLEFDGNHSLAFTFPKNLPDPYACMPWPAPDQGGGLGDPLEVWIAQYGSDSGSDGITWGSGQDAVVTSLRGPDSNGNPGGFVLINGSCQKYYVWIQARFALPTTPCTDDGNDGGTDDAPAE